MNRLRDDRHDCAHPAFSTEAELLEPSPELVRLHLVNAIDFVLSQEPLQGKAIFEKFSLDVQSAGFPRDHAKLQDYVAQRYLNRVRPRNIQNFGMVLTKSLLKGLPLEWENYRSQIIDTLVTVRERAFTGWPDIKQAIVRLIDSLEPVHRLRTIAFLGSFQDLWPLLEASTKTVLEETVSNLKVSELTDFLPFSDELCAEDYDALLVAIMANGQNSEAALTPRLLLDVLKNAEPGDLPTSKGRDKFYQFLRHFHRINLYQEVFDLFEKDGWVPLPVNGEESNDEE